MSNPYSPPLTSYPDTARPYQQPFLAEAGPTQLTIDVLRQTKPWVMFVSVLGFLGSALCALAGVGMMVIGAFGGMGAHTPAFPALALGAIYLPLALLYIYPSMKLWSYGSAIGRLVANRSSEDLEAALSHQKSFWKYVAIMTIVSMVIYFVAIIVIAVVGVASAIPH